MGLIETIQQADLVGLSDSDTLAALNQSSVIATSNARWTQAGVAKEYGVTVSEQLYSAIQAAGLAASAQTYVHAGIDLSDTETQTALGAIQAYATANSLPDLATLCGELKEVGITHGHRWQIPLNGITTQPTLAEITAARAEIARLEWCQHVIYDVIPAARDSANSTIDSIKSAIAGTQ